MYTLNHHVLIEAEINKSASQSFKICGVSPTGLKKTVAFTNMNKIPAPKQQKVEKTNGYRNISTIQRNRGVRRRGND